MRYDHCTWTAGIRACLVQAARKRDPRLLIVNNVKGEIDTDPERWPGTTVELDRLAHVECAKAPWWLRSCVGALNHMDGEEFFGEVLLNWPLVCSINQIAEVRVYAMNFEWDMEAHTVMHVMGQSDLYEPWAVTRKTNKDKQKPEPEDDFASGVAPRHKAAKAHGGRSSSGPGVLALTDGPRQRRNKDDAEWSDSSHEDEAYAAGTAGDGPKDDSDEELEAQLRHSEGDAAYKELKLGAESAKRQKVAELHVEALAMTSESKSAKSLDDDPAEALQDAERIRIRRVATAPLPHWVEMKSDGGVWDVGSSSRKHLGTVWPLGATSYKCKCTMHEGCMLPP